MSSQSSTGGTSVVRLVLAGLVVAVVAAGASLGYVGYLRGAFHKREKIAMVTWNQDSFWDPTANGAAEAAASLGVDLTFIRSLPTEAAQSQHIRDLIAAGVQGIAISPNNPEAQRAVIDDAAAKAVVVTFDSDAPGTQRRGFVGTDDYAAGQVAAGEVRAAIPDGGQVIVSVGNIDMSNGRDRRQALIDDLLDRAPRRDGPTAPLVGDLKGKKYDVVATVTDGGDVDAAVNGVRDAIKAHPDVKCIVGLFSYSGPAAVRGIDAAGKKGLVKVVGFDETPEEQADVAAGSIYASVLQGQYWCGFDTVHLLTDLIRGAGPSGPSAPRMMILPVQVMRADNISDLRATRLIREVNGG